MLKEDVNLVNELVLESYNRMFSIELSSDDYTQPVSNTYAYTLDGFDKEWFFVSSAQRRVQYTNLPAGKYMLRVKASNCDGIWDLSGR